MYLEEISKIESCKNEDELIKIVEEVGDKILFRGYEEEEVLMLVTSLKELDILSMKYETREEILSVLCDAVSYYDISLEINWNRISNVRDRLENDLKEYVDEFLHN